MESILLSHTPAEVIRSLLVDLGLAVFPEDQEAKPEDWLVFVSKLPENPNNIILLTDITGLKEGRVHNTGEVLEHYGIDIMVRGVREQTERGYSRAYRKIVDICRTFDQQVRNNQLSIGDSNYIVINMSRPGSIIPLGQNTDSNQRFIFTVSYMATIVEET